MAIRAFLAGLVAIGALAATASTAHAGIYGTAADLTGSRSFGAGLSGAIPGATGAPATATLEWTVTDQGAFYHYSYTLTTNSRQGVSHFIIDVSDVAECAAAYPNSCFENVDVAGGAAETIEFGDYSAANGNPGLPGTIIDGWKVNIADGASTFTVEFDSDRAPVWGDFYAKAGNGTSNGFSLYNGGCCGDLVSDSVLDFVARPDSVKATVTLPEPATIALLGLGLLGAGIQARRRRG